MSYKTDSCVPVESVLKMSHLEQYVASVISCSSTYCNTSSIFYGPMNITGQYSIYPSYGDYPETYMLKSYGNWPKASESYQKNYRLQDVDPLGAEDFIILRFDQSVVPREILIYETFNPGAVVRIWGGFSDKFNWQLLWEQEPQICPTDSRVFPPNIRPVNFLVNQIRLEFNTSKLNYFAAIDAVLLSGYYSVKPRLQKLVAEDFMKCISYDKNIVLNNQNNSELTTDENLFDKLPYEIVVKIFEYLDLKSLSRCAQVNRKWLFATHDQILYQNLSLIKYWHKVNETTLINYFQTRCRILKKLDLSWCGNYSEKFSMQVELFLKNYTNTLTHLSLKYCNFIINHNIIKIISKCNNLVELRLVNLLQINFNCLSNLNKLITLELSSTSIEDDQLIKILKSNPDLKHLIIDFCTQINSLDKLAETISANNKNLTVWSSWYASGGLSPLGISYLSNCSELKELDLGWCVNNDASGDCLQKIAVNCRNLRRLILSGWRIVNNTNLLPIIFSCQKLTQLDLLGVKSITSEICEQALQYLPNIRLLDISFSASISSQTIESWRKDFPQVTIQCSSY